MFISVLGQLGRRALVGELDENLAELVRQVRSAGKAGTLTLKLTVKPRNGDVTEVDITEAVTLSAPQPARKPSIFFTSEEGTLSRTDPNQADLPFEAHDGGKATIEIETPAAKAVAS